MVERNEKKQRCIFIIETIDYHLLYVGINGSCGRSHAVTKIASYRQTYHRQFTPTRPKMPRDCYTLTMRIRSSGSHSLMIKVFIANYGVIFLFALILPSNCTFQLAVNFLNFRFD